MRYEIPVIVKGVLIITDWEQSGPERFILQSMATTPKPDTNGISTSAKKVLDKLFKRNDYVESGICIQALKDELGHMTDSRIHQIKIELNYESYYDRERELGPTRCWYWTRKC